MRWRQRQAHEKPVTQHDGDSARVHGQAPSPESPATPLRISPEIPVAGALRGETGDARRGGPRACDGAPVSPTRLSRRPACLAGAPVSPVCLSRHPVEPILQGCYILWWQSTTFWAQTRIFFGCVHQARLHWVRRLTDCRCITSAIVNCWQDPSLGD